MRTKKQIAKSYLKLLLKESGKTLPEEEINQIVVEEQKALIAKVEKELISTVDLRNTKISSDRAWYIFCHVVINEDPTTGMKVWNSFVEEQFELIERHQLLCYMAPRGHGKSYISFCLYPIFKHYLIKGFESILISNIPQMTKNNFRILKRIIDANELLLEKKDTSNLRTLIWSTSEAEFNGGILRTSSLGSTPRSLHVNLIVLDDPLRDDNKYTEAFIRNYVLAQLKPIILRKKGRMVVDGTPQHQEDIFHYLMNTKIDLNENPIGELIEDGKVSYKGFYSKVFKAIINRETKEVLLPEVISYEELMQEEKTIGSIRFAREFMCQCRQFKTAAISMGLWKKHSSPDYSLITKGEQYIQPSKLAGQKKQYIMFVDPATSDELQADWSAAIILEQNEDINKRILRHIWHRKGMPITDPTGGTDDQQTELAQLSRDFNNCIVYIEKNNAGVALLQALQAKGITALEHVTGIEKPKFVIEWLQDFSNGEIIIPASPDDPYTATMIEKLRDECLNFGTKNKGGKEVWEALSGHDDLVDAFFNCSHYCGSEVFTLKKSILLHS